MIRRAHPSDVPWLVEMGHAFFREAGHEGVTGEFDPNSFAATLDVLAPHNLVLVMEEHGEVVGMAAADVAKAYWNHNVLLGREAFWYIKPEFRKGDGRYLLEGLENVARSIGAVHFDAVAEEGEGKRGEALGRLYRRASYRPVERTFRKRLL